ncbi:hypothetical protein [Natrinema salinisoli]|uniref:hypothetical protein n=1 Tax=Natrinema salinisoli TaxID=2878535 RepID=UPI001CF04B2A|nr:hypothetical protein [Natrinema salinisoli]
MRNIAVEGLRLLLGLFVVAAVLVTIAGGSLTGITEVFTALFIFGVIVALVLGAFNAG